MTELDRIFNRMLDVIEEDILPLTRVTVPQGHKIFGAAVLRREDLSLVVADTNHEGVCPLWHGEIYTIKSFYELEEHPDPRECLFLSTHEPCSMCLSAIAWAGFPEIYFLFNYDHTRDSFNIPYDLRMLEEVFYCSRPSRRNSFFQSFPLLEMISEVSDKDAAEVRFERLKSSYDELSSIYQSLKDETEITRK